MCILPTLHVGANKRRTRPPRGQSITEAVEGFFRCNEKTAWLVQGILSLWHFFQEISLKAEGNPETCPQGISPKWFVCFPWNRKWKSPKQMAVMPPLTPDLGGVCSSSRISRVFVIIATAIWKKCNESCPFLWKMSKHFQCFTLVYWKRAQYFNSCSIFLTFGFWFRLYYEDIKYDMKVISGCSTLDASLPPLYPQFTPSLPPLYHQYTAAQM